MKTITIEVPEGKRAEWVDGVLTLVDDKPVNFKFKVGDRVISIKYDGIFTVTRRFSEKGLPTYELRSIWGKSISSEIWLYLHIESKDITERIKTFEDACKWCKENGKEEYVKVFNIVNTQLWGRSESANKDIIAYLKLRIITAALNEGWEPTFEEGEERYSVVCNTDNSAGDLTFYCSDEGFSYAEAVKLLFKNQALVKYAATQFKDIYMDFCHKGKE